MSYDIVQEDVPVFVKRVGDHVIQGSNNTVIVLGTDRAAKGPATLSDGLGHINSPGGGLNAGSIHLIAGRKDKDGNPDMSRDLAFVYLSMNTQVDGNLGLEGVEGDVGKASTVTLKADTVRIVVRKDLKFSLDGGSTYVTLSKDKIVLEGKKIQLGKGAGKHLVRYEDMQRMFDQHKHINGAGVTSPPLPPNMKAQERAISTKSPNEILVTG